MDKQTQQHPPGPWRYSPWHIEEGPSAVRAPEGWLICETSSDANARLIAAAPELLEALIELHEAESATYPSSDCGQEAQTAWVIRKAEAHQRARAAIAKATGAA